VQNTASCRWWLLTLFIPLCITSTKACHCTNCINIWNTLLNWKLFYIKTPLCLQCMGSDKFYFMTFCWDLSQDDMGKIKSRFCGNTHISRSSSTSCHFTSVSHLSKLLSLPSQAKPKFWGWKLARSARQRPCLFSHSCVDCIAGLLNRHLD
jgi:hypothetical protein